MMVGDEDGAYPGKSHAGQCHLAGDAVATIDDIGSVSDQDHLCRSRPQALGRRSASGSEKDQARPRTGRESQEPQARQELAAREEHWPAV
jgi:hypothetical protein